MLRKSRPYFVTSLVLLVAAGLYLLSRLPARDPSAANASTSGNPPARKLLRLGLIPERDIYQQRAAYRALGEYLAPKLNARIELVTNSSYQGVLTDFAERKIDAAFLGSMVAALAIDRHEAGVLLKSQSATGDATYAGTIFVPESSPVRSFAELRGKTLGAVRTTTAGPLFPVYLMTKANMPDDTDGHDRNAPRFVWCGTHDDVIREVIAGRLDAGAVKDLRLDAYLADHPKVTVRRLATSARVPDNALVVHRDFADAALLKDALLALPDTPAGRGVLDKLGLRRFVPCDASEYAGLFDMIETIGPRWPDVGIDGPAPKRPATTPATTTGAPR